MRTELVLAVGALLPIVGVTYCVGVIADGVGARGAAAVAAIDRTFSSFGHAATGDELDPVEETLSSGVPTTTTAVGSEPSDLVEDEAVAAPPMPGPAPAVEPGPTRPSRGVHVGSETVLRLADSGARPGGSFAPARGDRPAGMVVSGVGGLGVGVRDGDVLTHVAGSPVRTRAAVVSAVIAARGRRSPSIGGRFWRDGEWWHLSVDLPYPGPE